MQQARAAVEQYLQQFASIAGQLRTKGQGKGKGGFGSKPKAKGFSSSSNAGGGSNSGSNSSGAAGSSIVRCVGVELPTRDESTQKMLKLARELLPASIPAVSRALGPHTVNYLHYLMQLVGHNVGQGGHLRTSGAK